MPRNVLDIVSQYAKNREVKGRKTSINVFILGGNTSQPIVRTGAGPDGIVQPDRPVMMVNTLAGPRLIHEDETLYRNPDGTVTVTPSEQTRLMQLQERGMPGYQTGGLYYPASPGTDTTFYSNEKGLMQQPPTSAISQRIATLKPIAQVQFNPQPVATNQQQQTAQVQFNPQPVATNQQQQNTQVQFNPQPVATRSQQEPNVSAPNVGLASINEANAIMRDVARGDSDVDRQIRQYYLGSWNMQASADDARLRQQLAAQGRTPEEINAIMLTRARDRDTRRAGLFSELGINQATRAQQAAQSLANIGQTLGQESRAQEEWAIRKRDEAEQEFTTYVQQMTQGDPNYDWTKDDYAVRLAQNAWTANNMPGQVDPNWGTNLARAVTKSPADIYMDSVKSQKWYQELPQERQATIDNAIRQVAQMMGLGIITGTDENGNTVIRGLDGETFMTISADGTVNIASGGAGGTGGTGTWSRTFTGNIENDNDIRAYVQGFTYNNVVTGTVTNNMMRQYLTTHQNNGPASAEDWENWLRTDYVFDVNDPNEANTAYDLLMEDPTLQRAEVLPSLDTVKMWIMSNGGKIGNTGRFIQFQETAPDISGIREWLVSGSQTTLPTNLRAAWSKCQIARDLMNATNKGTPEWNDRVRSLGFRDENDVAAYAYAADAISPVVSPIAMSPGQSANISTQRGGYSYTQHYMNDGDRQWVRLNTGKSVNISGKTLVVTGKMANHRYDNGSTHVYWQGAYLYEPSTGKYYVWYFGRGDAPTDQSDMYLYEFQSNQTDSIVDA